MNKIRLVLVLLLVVGLFAESRRTDEVTSTTELPDNTPDMDDDGPEPAEFPADDAYWPKEEGESEDSEAWLRL